MQWDGGGLCLVLPLACAAQMSDLYPTQHPEC